MAEHTINEGSAATPPTAAAATFTSLCAAVGELVGTTLDEERLGNIIHSGYLQFLYPPILPGEKTAHRWSFLRPTATLTAGGSDYLYDMPADFGAIVGDMAYDSDDDIARVVRGVSPGLIDRKRAENDIEGRPAYFALRPKSVGEIAVQVTECMLYPTPDATYHLIYYYDAKVGRLSGTNLYPLGGQPHSETLWQSCRDIAAQRVMDQPAGQEHELFIQRLQASVEYDRRLSPPFLGYNNETGRGPCITRHGSDFKCTLKHNLG